jgi:HEAT repeat protein
MNDMCDGQLDLFLDCPPTLALPSVPPRRPSVVVGDLGDGDLIAAITAAGMADALALMAEAGRRRLTAAVPTLRDICRRFAAFPVQEQSVALDALAAIGGPAATQAVVQAIVRAEVQGPTLAVAVSAAARLKAALPNDVVLRLLRHDDPAVRADTCRCARRHPDIIIALLDLTDDLHADVRVAAHCALGRLGRMEARPALMSLLQEAPTGEVVEALTAVADREAIVLLGRQAEAKPELRETVLDALEGCSLPLATTVVERLRATMVNK